MAVVVVVVAVVVVGVAPYRFSPPRGESTGMILAFSVLAGNYSFGLFSFTLKIPVDSPLGGENP